MTEFKQNFIYKNYATMDVDEREKDAEHKKQEIKEYIRLVSFIWNPRKGKRIL